MSSVGIYSLKSIKNENKMIIQPMGCIKDTERVLDRLIKSYVILDSVKGEIYHSNITNSYLMSTYKQPFLVTKVFIDKKVKSHILFELYLSFVITQKVNSSDEFINKPLDGKFVLDIVIDGSNRELDVTKLFDVFPSMPKVVNRLMNFTKTNEMMELIRELVKIYNDEIIKKYTSIYNISNLPTPTDLTQYLPKTYQQ